MTDYPPLLYTGASPHKPYMEYPPGFLEGILRLLLVSVQAVRTSFVIYIRDSIALRFEPFKRMYENGSKIKETYLSLRLCNFEVFVAADFAILTI